MYFIESLKSCWIHHDENVLRAAKFCSNTYNFILKSNLELHHESINQSNFIFKSNVIQSALQMIVNAQDDKYGLGEKDTSQN